MIVSISIVRVYHKRATVKNHYRNNAKIRSLNITKDKIDTMNKIMLDPTSSPKVKHSTIKNIMGVSPCCLCLAIPSVELYFRVGTKEDSIKVVEYYCDSCLKIVFSREKLEPSNKEDIPAYYDCVKVDQIPHSF
jgi:hypothetical protein